MTASGLLSSSTIAVLFFSLLLSDQRCSAEPAKIKIINLQSHPDTAVYLEQKSSLGKGIKCTITKRMFKLELAQPHCVFIADAENPKTILLYSPEHKLYFREPPGHLNSLGFPSDTRILFKNIKTKAAFTVAGIPATRYTSFPNAVIDNEIAFPTLTSSVDDLPAQHTRAAKSYKVIQADYYASTALNVPPKAIETMSSLVHSPHIDGLPLGLVVTKSDGRRASIFYTSSFSYVHVDKNFFQCPPAFKPARTDMECIFGSEKVGQLEDIFKDMAIGKDFGSEKKTNH